MKNLNEKRIKKKKVTVVIKNGTKKSRNWNKRVKNASKVKYNYLKKNKHDKST